jgi:hypothetical protein
VQFVAAAAPYVGGVSARVAGVVYFVAVQKVEKIEEIRTLT